MRQNVYTCCRCGEEQRTPADCDDAPLGWARVTFQRDYAVPVEGGQQIHCENLTTHACVGCCDQVLAFLEKISLDVDRNVDDRSVA